MLGTSRLTWNVLVVFLVDEVKQKNFSAFIFVKLTLKCVVLEVCPTLGLGTSLWSVSFSDKWFVATVS